MLNENYVNIVEKRRPNLGQKFLGEPLPKVANQTYFATKIWMVAIHYRLWQCSIKSSEYSFGRLLQTDRYMREIWKMASSLLLYIFRYLH